MKLQTNIPALPQIRAALQNEIPLYFDIRTEALGDKVAALNVIELLNRELGLKHDAIIPVESAETPRTPFTLMSYSTDVSAILRDLDDPLEDGLDVHTLGTGNESLWYLNAFAALHGIRGSISCMPKLECSGEIVICLLEHTSYNERRDMDPINISILVQLLEQQGYTVTVIAQHPHPRIPQIRIMSTEEAVVQIAHAALVIAGDTGFSHLAAACGRPLIGLWPDWHHFGSAKLADAIRLSDWWQLPLYQISRGFYPNGNPLTTKIVEIGTDHKFSPDHVLRYVQELFPLISKG